MARSKNLSLQDLQEIYNLLQGLETGFIKTEAQFASVFKLASLIQQPTYNVKRAEGHPDRTPADDTAYKYGLYFQNRKKHDVALHEKIVKLRAEGYKPEYLSKEFNLPKPFINQLVYIHKRYHNGCQPLQGRRGRPRKQSLEAV